MAANYTTYGYASNGTNINDSMSGDFSFFDTYYSRQRFILETVVCVVCVLFNTCALLVARRAAAGSHTLDVYHMLFVNLALVNILTATSGWATNNMLYLFQEELTAMLVHDLTMVCRVFLYLFTGVFVSSALGVISSLTMLGFTMVQCIAVCRPLQHQSIVRKRRLVLYISCSWLLTLALSSVSLIILYTQVHSLRCSPDTLQDIVDFVIRDAEISVAIVAVVYALCLAACIKIRVEIRHMEERLSQFRYDNQVSTHKRFFVTTVIFLFTLFVFVLPYTVVFIVSLNKADMTAMQNNALIYYMTLLPYFKFILDPVIYGLRMSEIQAALNRLAEVCGLKRCPCLKQQHNVPPTPTSPNTGIKMFTY